MSNNKDEFTLYKEKAKLKSSEEIIEGFVSLVEQELHLRSNEVRASDSFWYHRPTKNFPPQTIMYPSEYHGEEYVSIACTQTDLKASEQKKLIKSWCEILPTLEKIKFIWFVSRATQELFDAVCEVKSLKGLYIKWSGIKSIDNIVKMQNLKYLRIGSSPSLSPLEPLNKLPKLEWLELENIRACSDLSFLTKIIGLKGLSIAGDGNSIKYMKAKSLEPLRTLKKLYWLSLGTFMVEDGSLLPLAELKNLKFLIVSNKYKMEEIAKLAGIRPDVDCDLFEPFLKYDFFTCKKCAKNTVVLLTGKGKPWLCLDCDIKRIEKHVKQFNTVSSEYYLESTKSNLKIL